MNRTRDYQRYQRNQHINRKIGICKRKENCWPTDVPGKFNKGKIHCSCWMCRTKSYDHSCHGDELKELDYIQQLNDLFE